MLCSVKCATLTTRDNLIRLERELGVVLADAGVQSSYTAQLNRLQTSHAPSRTLEIDCMYDCMTLIERLDGQVEK